MVRFLLPVLLLIAAAVFYRYESVRHTAELERVGRRLALADRENARLRGLVEAREQEKRAEENAKWRASIEGETAKLRELEFKTPVTYEIIPTREELRRMLAKKLDETVSAAEFDAFSKAWARLGLVPEGYPLRDSYLDLLGEQVAAFYDQHTHKLYMFADATLDNAQNRIVLAHELTHALQDQHFDLRKLPLEIKDNDDRALAASSLVEGDATILMTQYQLANFSLKALRESVSTTLGQSMAQLERAPQYLRELLIFPYLRGQQFCQALEAQGGYDRIDQAYRELPFSSSQILHPEEYLQDPKRQPVEVTWPDMTFEGEKAAVNNVLGEAGLRVQLALGVNQLAAERAAAGWRGDRFLHFAKHDALVWKSVWANASEAAEFASAQRQGLQKRYALSEAKEDGVLFAADAPRAVRVIQEPETSSVLVIDAADAGTAEKLQQQFGKTR